VTTNVSLPTLWCTVTTARYGMCQHQHLRTTVELLVSVHKYISPPHIQSFWLSVRPILVCQDIVVGQWKMLIISSAYKGLATHISINSDVTFNPHYGPPPRTSTLFSLPETLHSIVVYLEHSSAMHRCSSLLRVNRVSN